MVNVSELIELRFGNQMKQCDNQSRAGGDFINEVRVSTEVMDERVLNPNVAEGGFNGVERVSEEVVEGLELNEINLAVHLSTRKVSDDVGVFKQNGIGLNGVNLVVDLSPRRCLDGRKDYSGAINVPVSNSLGVEWRTEMEGNYEVTDLVWGKVRSHPWWPGQIIDPIDASEKAKKHFKKDCFLIAYFGDQTYAWNDVSQIKPFRKHFSRMVKQSNTEGFCHAVECALHEVSRRIKFGLACSCLSDDILSEIKSQVVVNAGVSEESRRRDGGDRFSSVASFVPAKLVEILKALAIDPFSRSDRLGLLQARAQLLVYNQWKGCCRLPDHNLLNGLVENADSEPDSGKENVTDEEIKYGKGKFTTLDSYARKGKHVFTEGVSSSKKVKRLSELMPVDGLNVQNNSSVKADRKRKVIDSLSDDSRDGSGTVGKKSLTPAAKKTYKIAENIRRIALKLSTTSSFKNGDRSCQNSVIRNSGKPSRVCQAIPPSVRKEFEVPPACPSSDEILSQLHLAAIDPMNGNNSLTSLVSFFSDFRSYSAEISSKRDVSQINGIEDSYWTDRIIQSNPEEQVLIEPEVASLESNQEKPTCHLNDKCKKFSGAALILNFDKKISVPSVNNLTDIYTKYGPLEEVSRKNKSARVVFENRSDAEAAFSRAGKYSLFGLSLLSYTLDYSPKPRKITVRARRKTKEKDAALGNVQELED